ncbi:hypothetical protein LPJ58_000855 [Coemansia sp. RSA 1591]|nr:hypothetical protein LPJ58_000855 [Coemansia sp. RSA 1591]KAJ1766521.1 hypothetical protein LPJ69_000842 [Coemansia sp. RSA 1752]KAJ1794371.1 hypothetical protein LPJ67_000792 [Coemansia sp. RSA 1938]KAJ2447551.1 hypothetical protein IWW46_000222 [Coemansia sp. RSA 2440]
MSSASLAAPILRSLKIKTGAVKRLVREREVYILELDKQRERIETLRNKEGVEGADIRKQNEVLEETLQMIPYMERRIREAMQDLENLVIASKKDDTLVVSELCDADEAIASAKQALPDTKEAKQALPDTKEAKQALPDTKEAKQALPDTKEAKHAAGSLA